MNPGFPLTISGLSTATETSKEEDKSMQKTAVILASGVFVLNLAILSFAGYGVYKFATRKKKGKK